MWWHLTKIWKKIVGTKLSKQTWQESLLLLTNLAEGPLILSPSMLQRKSNSGWKEIVQIKDIMKISMKENFEQIGVKNDFSYYY